jgi:pilus assembly protein CpaB
MALKFPKISINRTWLMLVVAIVLALLATLLTTQYLKNREQSLAQQMAAKANQGGPKVGVVVPVRDLPVGTALDGNLVAERDVQADLIYPDAIKVEDFDKYKGQSLIRPVYRGRPLLTTDLRPMYVDFAGTLTPGTRAMTIDIDELNSIAHMVQPGNRIDLMLVMKREDGGQTVVPFMDQMKVLATGQKLIQDTGEDKAAPQSQRARNASYSNVTLEVTPVQAARLTLAQDIGKLRAVLRNESDKKESDFTVDAQNIFEEVAERKREAQAHAPRHSAIATGMVEYIVGGNRAGPAARAVDVPTTASSAAGGAIPPLIPNHNGPAPGTMAPSGSAAPSAPATSGYGAPAAGPAFDSAGMTPDMRNALKNLLDKSN